MGRDKISMIPIENVLSDSNSEGVTTKGKHFGEGEQP